MANENIYDRIAKLYIFDKEKGDEVASIASILIELLGRIEELESKEHNRND